MLVDYCFVFKVAFYMLPKPKRVVDILDVDRAESLEELGVICEGYRVC